MFDRRHFYYTFTFTASNENHTATYTFDGSSDDMDYEFDRAKQMFYEEFNEYPTDIHRDSAIRIE